MSIETKRDKTKVCCLDLDEELIEYLKEKFDVYNGSLGNLVDVAGLNKYGLNLLLNYVLPENLQEYDVFIEDMAKKDPVEYNKTNHTRTAITETEVYYFRSDYPQTIFDPRPYSSLVLTGRLKKQRNKPAIKIVFQDALYDIKYVIADIRLSYTKAEVSYNNYQHLPNFCLFEASGKEVKLCDNKLSNLLFEPLLNDITYCQTYRHPTRFVDKKNVNDERFIPLLKSRDGSIISFIWLDENDITIMLPQTKRKKELLENVFNNLLFQNFSDYFPEIEESIWINNSSCYLPNHECLLNEKSELEKKYKEDLKNIDERIKQNNTKYGYLHTLLNGTGDELVDATIKFLKWLGFENVVDKDEHLDKNFNEEDIQIDVPNEGLLLLEVKGINGTSTDAKCSQITKVVHRRSKEQKRFDVHGLYIVNNEKNIAPESRTTPPFNEQQIKDAVYDERGLCYTWQLFNLFFEIEENIILKDDARKVFFTNGLIEFKPDVIEVGIPHNYYQKHQVICLKVGTLEIKVGDYFLYEENQRWKNVKIETIKDDGKSFESATNGSFGFGLQHRVPDGKVLYIKAKK